MKRIRYKRGGKPGIDRLASSQDAKANNVARDIVESVRDKGDTALFDFTKKLDFFELSEKNIRIPARKLESSLAGLEEPVRKALEHAARNIRIFHENQYDRLEKNWSIEVESGVNVGEKTTPIDSAGCYVPGGRAAYPSTVLMTCIPASVAGVERIVLASPPPVNDIVLAAACIVGVKEVYQMGGAQAISALAYGTESVRRVSKIVGPGNKYVNAAKRMVYGEVDIDTPAGPSELAVIADDSADPGIIALDLMAQAEHDPDARVVLVSTSKELGEKVEAEIERRTDGMARNAIIGQCMENAVIVVTDIDGAIEYVNKYAPEHLEIITEDARSVAERIVNAGAIFIGAFTPVAAGDYATGANHTLPTGGAARFNSPLSVRDFLKTSCVQELSREGLDSLSGSITTLADAEGLTAHAESVRERSRLE